LRDIGAKETWLAYANITSWACLERLLVEVSIAPANATIYMTMLKNAFHCASSTLVYDMIPKSWSTLLPAFIRPVNHCPEQLDHA
jgi:hypothetical protein